MYGPDVGDVQRAMKERLEALLAAGRSALLEAETLSALQDARVRFLGKKGEMTLVMKGMGQLSPEERPRFGALANQVKEELEGLFEERAQSIRASELDERLASERIDVSLPGRRYVRGTKHPITLVTEEIIDIFSSLGFGVAEGPEVEMDFYNFAALNMPKKSEAKRS